VERQWVWSAFDVTVTLEVPDDLYQSLAHDAAQRGQLVKDVAVRWLATHFRQQQDLTVGEQQAAMDRLLRFAGAFASGDSKSSRLLP